MLITGTAVGSSCGGGGHDPVDARADCGPGDAPEAGAVASGTAVTLTYGHLVGGLNNDCPSAGTPAGVISLTIQSTQTDGTGNLTLCIARPDLLATQAQALGLDRSGSEIRIVDLNGTANGCSFKIDTAQTPTGSATSSGMCSNGGDPAGFALVLDGALSLTRTCSGTVDSVPITLRGRVAVGSP